MKKICLSFFLMFLWIFGLLGQEGKKAKIELSISIPQSSGIAFASFKHYRVSKDTLYVFYQQALDTTLKLLESHPIEKDDLLKLDSLFEKTDSFGHHTVGFFTMGWPRFFIYGKSKEKVIDGYIANCYRRHIFVFVDWLNKVYPEKNVINYSREELVKREKEEKLEEQRHLEKLIRKENKQKRKN